MKLESIRKQVESLFGDDGYYCAETVLKLIADGGGKDASELIGLATGFCSGASRTCGQCGAVSGAVMGIGLFAGRYEPGGEYEPAYAMVQEFMERFKQRFGAINCYDLVQCDFADPEGQAKFKREGLKTNCIEFSAFAVGLVLELLRREGYISEENELIASRLGPCGLSCGNCLAFVDGPISNLSGLLAERLGERFGEYAKRFEAMNPVFEHYDSFRTLLDYFASGSCQGCRESGCLFKDCKVTGCAKEHGVDFCFQCDEFPCDKHGMPDGLSERWQANNEKMAEIGSAAWYCQCKDKPRYP